MQQASAMAASTIAALQRGGLNPDAVSRVARMGVAAMDYECVQKVDHPFEVIPTISEHPSLRNAS